jgi:hypothetical protein
MDNPMDNAGGAPMIPSGTQPTVFGQKSFVPGTGPLAPAGVGQAIPQAPGMEQPVGQAPQVNPVQAPVVQGEEQGTTFQDIMAKKGFKSPDELAKAYQNLESFATKQSMDLADLVQAKLGADPSQVTPVQPNGQNNYAPEEAIGIVQSMIQQAIAPMREKLEVQEAFKDPSDFQFASQVAEMVKQNPSIPWKVALDAVKFRQGGERLKEEGRKEAYGTIQQKQSVQQTADAFTGIKPEVDVQKIISDPNVPFSEVQRIMKERFAQ